MTVPYAPGFVPVQPQPPALPPGYQYATQPGFAPPPAYPQAPPPGYPQAAPPQYPQQPGYPQMPAGFPQGGAVDLNQRLFGPGIPAELQGKTVGEGLRYYGIMREDFIRRGQQPQQPQQQPQGYQPPQYGQPPIQQQPGQPQYQQQPGGPPSAVPRVPGAPVDPQRQFIAEAIQEALAPVVAPLQQQNFQRIYGEVRARYPDWAQHEATIIQSMQGADPQTMANPAAWEAAYRHAVGDAIVRQRQGQHPPSGPGFQPYSFGGFQVAPPQQNPQAQYLPPQGAAGAPTFVESPTPPPPQMPQQGYDPADEMAARRFNMPVEVYRSWKGGRVGLLAQPTPGIAPQNPFGVPVQQAPPGYPQYPQPQYPPQGYPQIPPGYYQPPIPNNGVGYGR